MSGNGDSSGLDRMLVLAMTPFRRDKKPSIFFNNFDDFPDFQDKSPIMYCFFLESAHTLWFPQYPRCGPYQVHFVGGYHQ